MWGDPQWCFCWKAPRLISPADSWNFGEDRLCRILKLVLSFHFTLLSPELQS